MHVKYKDIPDYVESARQGAPVVVELGLVRGSIYRYFLWRETRARELSPSGARYFLDAMLMLMIMAFCRRLILLAYYHKETLESYRAISIQRSGLRWLFGFNLNKAEVVHFPKPAM